MEYVLYAIEVYCNMAAAQMQVCDVGGGMRSLVTAHQYRCKPEHDIIDLIMLNPTTTVCVHGEIYIILLLSEF